MVKPVVLIILDGWGIAPAGPGNAVSQANIPNFRKLWASFPHTKLFASGEAVGLPRGERGNSETGHLNLGAGRVVYQDLPKINMSIADGSFFRNPAFLKAAGWVKQHHSSLHLLGLIGQGGVHSSNEHLFALLQFCRLQGLDKVYLHLFTDGRDSPPTSAQIYLTALSEEIKKIGPGEIATISGRYYAMDRDNRWERTETAYNVLVLGEGVKAASWQEALKNAYKSGLTDEFILPTVIIKNGQPFKKIEDNDAVIFYNFRIDRPRQLTKAFVLSDLESAIKKKPGFDPYTERYLKKTYGEVAAKKVFERKKILKNILFITMTQYEKGLPTIEAFPPAVVSLPLSQVLSGNGIHQLHLAETEKERFITYYFDGQREKPSVLEMWAEIPSPDVSTYDLRPEMSAFKLTDYFLKNFESSNFGFVLLNFANPDMVGHTGVITAGIKACEAVDLCLGKIVDKVLGQKGACIITSDHGNVEEMINLTTGEIDTEHSTNLVPFMAACPDFRGQPKELETGILADVAPTVLSLLGINKPAEMIGKSLI